MLDAIAAIATIITPLLLLLLTGAGWKYRQSMERKLKLEEKLRDDRVEIYNQILEPFIILLMPDTAWTSDRRNKGKNKNQIATTKLLSLDYRKTSFNLALLGSDTVVITFNNLMQFFYALEAENGSLSADQANTAMSLLGEFLLEIRRSMGNESTRIDNWGMLEWFLKDARKLRGDGQPNQRRQ